MKTKLRVIKPKEEGQKPIKFHEGGLHESTNTKSGDKIPASKMSAAMHGEYGSKAKKQAMFAKNVLTGGK